jgi:cytochrome b
MSTSSAANQETGATRFTRVATVKVWDRFIRIFHWSIVGLFALAWATEDLQALHQPAGYVILGLVALRVIWGFIGSPHARFSDFVRSPAATFAYARDLLAGRAPRLLGHNPLAAVMILVLIGMLIATGASGWMMTLDSYRSADWLEELHEGLAAVTLALVCVHVLAVVVMSALHGENLVRAMITGRKAP